MIALWLDNPEHAQAMEFRGHSSRRESDGKVDISIVSLSNVCIITQKIGPQLETTICFFNRLCNIRTKLEICPWPFDKIHLAACEIRPARAMSCTINGITGGETRRPSGASGFRDWIGEHPPRYNLAPDAVCGLHMFLWNVPINNSLSMILVSLGA